ncbi:MAG: ABC transporter ATP-binding protein/permease [Bacilli bacterium]|nr:ABC transporter ATP-binding protein/permease [Bacilli bacterium]
MASAVSSVCTVLIPFFEKAILDGIGTGSGQTRNIAVLICVCVASAIALFLCAFITTKLYYSFKKELEYVLLHSLSQQESKTVSAKGSGAFLGAVFGDSEQIASVVAVNYFSIAFTLVASIASIVISAVWSLTFLFIAGVSYLLILAVIFAANGIFLSNLKKGKEEIYSLNPKVLEFIENKNSILSYSSFDAYEQSMFAGFTRRDSFFIKANLASDISKISISVIQSLALAVFFAFAAFDLEAGRLDVSTLVALISYFSVIFLPIGSVKEMYENIQKFNVFFEKVKGPLCAKTNLCIPKDGLIRFDGVSCSYGGKAVLRDITFPVDGKIALIGLSGEGKTTLIKLLFGSVKPTLGQVSIGQRKSESVSRNLLFSCVRYYSQDLEIFDDDLLFNITLGKKGLSVEKYQEERERYAQRVFDTFSKVVENAAFSRKNIAETTSVLCDIYALDPTDLKDKGIQNDVFSSISAIDDIRGTSRFVSDCIFPKKFYATERLDRIIADLELEKLEGRKFGQRGSNISGGEKARVSLARFLLPLSENSFVLDEPLLSLDLLAQQKLTKVLKRYLGNQNGIIITHDLGIAKTLSEKIFILDDATIKCRGTHEELLTESAVYKDLYLAYSSQK